MGLTEQVYSICNDAPKPKDWDEYCAEKAEEYQGLVAAKETEDKYQSFFEENPSFIPGALELFGQSGHYPYMDALISQPTIGSVYERKPDFLWLAHDSLNFCPVFIEIEKPSKTMFTEAGIPNAEFNQALNQIDEWRLILSNADNQRLFYKEYMIPAELQSKAFLPQFLLVYGRRAEYEDDEKLTNLRAAKQRDNVAIMSFDRLVPIADYRQFVTVKVKEGKYEILHIPPTFKYRPDCIKSLSKYKNFSEAIERIKGITDERRKFLKERYPYWMGIASKVDKGVIKIGEGE